MQCCYCEEDYLKEHLVLALDASDNEISICDSCAENEFHSCVDCGIFAIEIVTTFEDEVICNNCYEAHYFICNGCEGVLPNGQYAEEGYCHSCWDDDDDNDDVEEDISNVILNTLLPYNADPLPSIKNIKVFNTIIEQTPQALLSGVEVEVASKDRNEGRLEAIRKYKEIFKDFGCLKHDGSIKDARGYYTGFEIVSMPMFLKDHQNYDAWHKLLENEKDLLHVNSGDFGAGIHVHLNRKAFTTSILAHFIAFVHNRNNKEFIRKIAERPESRYAVLEEKNPFIHINENYNDKYQAVRLNKSSTIELRIFNSILKPISFFKNIEFTYALFEYCSYLSIKTKAPNCHDYRIFLAEKVNNYKSFIDWVSDKDKSYPHLIAFMEENNIFDEYKKDTTVKVNIKNKVPNYILEAV